MTIAQFPAQRSLPSQSFIVTINYVQSCGQRVMCNLASVNFSAYRQCGAVLLSLGPHQQEEFYKYDPIHITSFQKKEMYRKKKCIHNPRQIAPQELRHVSHRCPLALGALSDALLPTCNYYTGVWGTTVKREKSEDRWPQRWSLTEVVEEICNFQGFYFFNFFCVYFVNFLKYIFIYV